MNVALERFGAVDVARLRGDIDMSNTASITAAILAAIEVDDTAVVLDLDQVSYLDSAGVQMLFDLARRLDASRRAFGIVIGENAPARAVLKISHADEVAVICASTDECIEAVSGRVG